MPGDCVVLRERREERAVPNERFRVVRRLLFLEPVVLIERVIVIREVLEVRLQVREHLRPLGRVEVLPVLALQARTCVANDFFDSTTSFGKSADS